MAKPPINELSVTRYTLDASASRFTVQAFASGMLSAFGHNPTIAIREFTGEVRLATSILSGSAMSMKISAESLMVRDQISDNDRREIEHLMRQQVLETDRYPWIVYESSDASGTQTGVDQYRVTLLGRLTLHGVTRDFPVPAYVSLSGATLRATGDFTVRQTDFDIRPVKALAGTLKVKDELKLAFDIAAKQQQGAR